MSVRTATFAALSLGVMLSMMAWGQAPTSAPHSSAPGGSSSAPTKSAHPKVSAKNKSINHPSTQDNGDSSGTSSSTGAAPSVKTPSSSPHE